MSWRWSTRKGFIIIRALSSSKCSRVWVPRAQDHCLLLCEPRFLQGKLSVSQRGSDKAQLRVSGLVPHPHPPKLTSVLSKHPGLSVPTRASPGTLSPLPGPARPQAARPTPDSCAPTSCLGAHVCCLLLREHALSRSSSLASNATSSRKSSEADSRGWPSASCWGLSAHHSAPLSPRPRVYVPAHVEAMGELLIKTKDQAGLSHQEQSEGTRR